MPRHCQTRRDMFFREHCGIRRYSSLGRRWLKRGMKKSSRHRHLRDLLPTSKKVSPPDQSTRDAWDRRLTACWVQYDEGRIPAAACSSVLSGAGPESDATAGGELAASACLLFESSEPGAWGLLGLLGSFEPGLWGLLGLLGLDTMFATQGKQKNVVPEETGARKTSLGQDGRMFLASL